MLRRFRDRLLARPPVSGGQRRADNRRRPSLEGLEGRQLLSSVTPSASAAVSSPQPGANQSGVPVVVRYTSLPPLRAWAGQEFQGVVASFISNTQFAPDRLVASVNWGDGQASLGAVELNPWGGFNVRASHTYASNVQGPTWVRIDLVDVETGQWVTGVEQRAFVSRPSPTRTALFASGTQVPGTQFEPTDRAQPARLRFVERRQQFHDASERHSQGTASPEDLRFLRQVRNFQEEQNKGFFEKIGDNFSNAWPF
ncbi:hypothetical protein [Tautonia rosea]|uniref:hypothetical protein n=1 Tax=Tautonia rosea TaxID=2728037 RepID=UPI001475CF7F|nr:hypothetical protein [Tautonia rosea]